MSSGAPPVVARPLFLLDYDGTLAPLAAHPAQACPHPRVPGLLRDLSRCHPVWLVSGRHLRDLSAFLPGLVLPAIGLHGAQQGMLGGPFASLMSKGEREALQHLRETVPAVAGLWAEGKDSAFALHFRQALDEAEMRRLLQAWAAGLPEGLEAVWGHKVLEVRTRRHSKGRAVLHIADAHPGRAPVCLGDDATDEEAFAALEAQAAAGTLTIRVGPGATRARYHLPDVEAAVAYLQQYL
ncbi:MAG: trehalose-phosphatase [Candidatus Latescibacterota bacterium]